MKTPPVRATRAAGCFRRELLGCQGDGHAHAQMLGIAPARQLSAALLDPPSARRKYQGGILGQLDELVRRSGRAGLGECAPSSAALIPTTAMPKRAASLVAKTGITSTSSPAPAPGTGLREHMQRLVVFTDALP
jgi:hypothetical protein